MAVVPQAGIRSLQESLKPTNRRGGCAHPAIPLPAPEHCASETRGWLRGRKGGEGKAGKEEEGKGPAAP
jgi:hypothetical protein